MGKPFYEFKREDAEDFARTINSRTFIRGDELHFQYCPYCHGGSKRDKDTFSINMNGGLFKCLRASCGVQGNMIRLSQDFDFSLGRADEYYKPKKKYKTYAKPKEPMKPKPPAIAYMESRGISEEITTKYQITTYKDDENVVVFSFFDTDGRIAFIKYRRTNFDKAIHKSKEWCAEGCKPILYGMELCTDTNNLVITEGQIDTLSVAEAFKGMDVSVVSVPTGAKGFTWMPYCWDWMQQFKTITVFGDLENGHMSLLDELRDRFKRKVKNVRFSDYKGCKDANEILKKYGGEQVRNCVCFAEMPPIRRLIRPKDIKWGTNYKMPKIATGISVIDRNFYGGFPLGSVAIITGKTNEGKSPLVSMMLANALDKGIQCFAYSGELDKQTFKETLYRQIAGPSHMVEHMNSYGDSEYELSANNIEMIDSKYNDNLLIYDTEEIDDDKEDETLLELMEDAYSQFGTQYFVLDNLMTAIDLEGLTDTTNNSAQITFSKRVQKFALRHKAVVVLVAHKKKADFNNDVNEQVKGASETTNLGGIVISYERGKDIEPNQRLLKIAKNRWFGKTNLTGFVMDYDEASKRIYGRGDDVNKAFAWDLSADGYKQVTMDDETPFD